MVFTGQMSGKTVESMAQVAGGYSKKKERPGSARVAKHLNNDTRYSCQVCGQNWDRCQEHDVKLRLEQFGLKERPNPTKMLTCTQTYA